MKELFFSQNPARKWIMECYWNQENKNLSIRETPPYWGTTWATIALLETLPHSPTQLTLRLLLRTDIRT